MEERIQVCHNYISAISNHEHKKDLINRLKRSDPHNIPAYEAEMTCHMGRILTILKQDDYCYYISNSQLLAITSQNHYHFGEFYLKIYFFILLYQTQHQYQLPHQTL